MIKKESKELDILVAEHKRLNEDIQRLLGKNEKIGAFWLLIMSSIFGIALKETELKGLFLIIPPLFLFVFFYIINVFEFIMMTGGHIAAIEIRINKLVGANVVLWESYLTKKFGHNRKSATFILLFFIITSSGVMLSSLYLGYKSNRLFSLINIIFIFISLFIIPDLLKKLFKLHDEVKESVMALHKKKPQL